MRRALCLVAVLAACSAARPERFETAQVSAEKAYSAGRYEESARYWLEAARQADTQRDRQEAEYRAAASYERAQRWDEATRWYETLTASGGERAPRAALARAELEQRAGHDQKAQALRLELARRYPSTGPGDTALRDYISKVEQSGGKAEALTTLERLLAELGQTELDERLRYERARRLDELGQWEQARSAYLDCARRHPYPDGALWDDALFRAAQCDRKLGQPEQAIATLERLLREREAAHMTGSYERGRYAEARFAIAELYRDALKDPARARREFRRVWVDHPTSLLRDDALFEEALLAHAQGDREGACSALRLLAGEDKDSRFVPCAPRLCPSMKVDERRTCRAYLERRIDGPANTKP